MFFFSEAGKCPRPPIWIFMLFDLRIEYRIMSTIIIVYTIGHNIMKTATPIPKIASAGLAFVGNRMGAGG